MGVNRSFSACLANRILLRSTTKKKKKIGVRVIETEKRGPSSSSNSRVGKGKHHDSAPLPFYYRYTRQDKKGSLIGWWNGQCAHRKIRSQASFIKWRNKKDGKYFGRSIYLHYLVLRSFTSWGALFWFQFWPEFGLNYQGNDIMRIWSFVWLKVFVCDFRGVGIFVHIKDITFILYLLKETEKQENYLCAV